MTKENPQSVSYDEAYEVAYNTIMEVIQGELSDPCPECGTELEALWSGVNCPSCEYWFCF